MPVSLTVKGAKEVLNAFKTTADSVDDLVHETMLKSMLWLEADMRRHAPRDTGQLANSITHRVTGSGKLTEGEVGPTVAYWPFVEKGTKAHWPPRGAISPWAKRHGANPFVVARGISLHGTKAQPFVRPAWEKNEHAIRDLFQAIGLKIGLKFASSAK